jgi:ABC-type sugar transport system substrate-binding protein
MRRALALIPIALFATVLAAGPRSARAEAPLVVGYVTKSATNQGWVLINRGAQDAANDARVRLIVGGPSARGALAGQIDAIGRVIAEGAKVVALAPVDSAGVVPIVRRASAGGTPFVAIDTAIDAPVDAPLARSYVATDNLAAARAQAEWVAGAIGDADEVILVNGSLAQSTGRDRRQGFLDRLKELRPQAVVHEVHTDWDADQARAGVEREMRAHPEVAAIANAWDDGTLGAVAALQSLGMPKGQVRVVGFDGAPTALMLLKAGWVHADVGQRLYRQGYEGVRTAVAVARGEAVPPRVDTGFEVVTAGNLDRFVADNKLAEFMY